jgi:hypothetical protein
MYIAHYIMLIRTIVCVKTLVLRNIHKLARDYIDAVAHIVVQLQLHIYLYM